MGEINRAIRINNLSFRYNQDLILDNVSIDIFSKKLTFILGKNGSGKSTFLRIIAGLQNHFNGQIRFFENGLHEFSLKEKAKILGFLSQKHSSVFPFSVKEVVLTGRTGYINYVPGKEDHEKSLAALEKTGIIYLRDRNYCELSGGEQQLVMIARVLAQEPKIFLLDEPTSHLDFSNQSKLLELLKQLVSEGMTIVAVLHDPNTAFLYGDDFIFVKDKKLFRPHNIEPWNEDFLTSIYESDLITIPYKERALIIPDTKFKNAK